MAIKKIPYLLQCMTIPLVSMGGKKPLVFYLHVALALSLGQGQSQKHSSLLPPQPPASPLCSFFPMPTPFSPPYCQAPLGFSSGWCLFWAQSIWKFFPLLGHSAAATLFHVQARAELPFVVLQDGETQTMSWEGGGEETGTE